MEIKIRSKRGTDIPLSVFESENGNGLLLFAHSFKSDRSENGRFDKTAKLLNEYGWNAVSLDFPGNGESEEVFSVYSLRNCLDDMESAYAYMKETYPLDETKLALLGYSMGGRLISLFFEKHHEFNNLVFWAACNESYTWNDRFLEQDLLQLKKDCQGSGYCDFYDIFDDIYERMSEDFIDDLVEQDALEPLHPFSGRALIIQGDADSTIDPDNAELIYDSLKFAETRRICWIHDADHGFGLWDGRREDSDRLIAETVRFLKEA